MNKETIISTERKGGFVTVGVIIFSNYYSLTEFEINKINIHLNFQSLTYTFSEF